MASADSKGKRPAIGADGIFTKTKSSPPSDKKDPVEPPSSSLYSKLVWIDKQVRTGWNLVKIPFAPLWNWIAGFWLWNWVGQHVARVFPILGHYWLCGLEWIWAIWVWVHTRVPQLVVDFYTKAYKLRVLHISFLVLLALICTACYKTNQAYDHPVPTQPVGWSKTMLYYSRRGEDATVFLIKALLVFPYGVPVAMPIVAWHRRSAFLDLAQEIGGWFQKLFIDFLHALGDVFVQRILPDTWAACKYVAWAVLQLILEGYRLFCLLPWALGQSGVWMAHSVGKRTKTF